MEHVKRAHPLGVTFRKVVVDCYDVYTITGQGVQEYRQSGHQCLTFTSRHLRDLSFVKYDTTKQLDIVMNHIPSHVITSSFPVVLVDCLVVLNTNEVEFCRELAVKIISRNNHFRILSEAAGCVFHNGKSLGQDLLEYDLHLIGDRFLDFINLGPNRLTLLEFFVLDTLA